MTVKKQLGMRIAYLRKLKGWSQLDLSLAANVNRNYISDLEKGRRNPTVDVLQRIADAFNITLEFLFKGIVEAPGL